MNAKNNNDNTSFWNYRIAGVHILLCVLYWTIGDVGLKELNKFCLENDLSTLNITIGKPIIFCFFIYLHNEIFNKKIKEDQNKD